MSKSFRRVIAVDPTTQGFAYAILEGSEFLVDWGLVHIPKRDVRVARERFDLLVLRYLPDLLVLEDVEDSLRGHAARRLIRRLKSRAAAQGIAVSFVSREQVKAIFHETGFTKQKIAEGIADRFPELASRLPKKRQPWESEVERMSIFDAISFALTALSQEDLPSIQF